MNPEQACTDSIGIYSEAELNHFQQLLLAQRKSAKREMAYLKSEFLSEPEFAENDTPYGFHLAGAATRTREREKMGLFLSREQKNIRMLNAALQRIHNGTYGICRITGKRISKRRLEANPHTDISIAALLEPI